MILLSAGVTGATLARGIASTRIASSATSSLHTEVDHDHNVAQQPRTPRQPSLPLRSASVTANVMVVVERQFDQPRGRVFRAWVEPDQLSQWRGSPGWHVEESTAEELGLGARHRHIQVRDADATTRVTTDGVYSEYFDPDVFVSRERISGDPGIDPDTVLELRVEFNQYGRNGTLLRIIQGPYNSDVAGWHGEGWEKELVRLAAYLAGEPRTGEAR